MRISRLGERIGAVDAELQPAITHRGQDVRRALEQFRALGNVVRDGWSRYKQTAFAVERLRIDGRRFAAGLSKDDHIAPRAQTIEAGFEGALADSVINDVDATAQAFDFGDEILLRIQDDVVRAGRPG